MGTYVLRRLLLAVPTLGLVTLLAFALCVQAPGDPLAGDCPSWEDGVGTQAYERCREARLQAYGRNLPLFYASVASLAEPDTLHRILEPSERAATRRWLYAFGNPQAVHAYRLALHRLVQASRELSPPAAGAHPDPFQARNALLQMQNACRSLLITGQPTRVDRHYLQADSLQREAPFLSPLAMPLQQAQAQWAALPGQAARWRYYIPWIHFHGWDNQYHRWLTGIFRGDWGLSYRYKRPIGALIRGFLGWTVLFTGLAVLIAYLLGLPLGILAAAQAGKAFDRGLAVVLFALHALPAFWVATLLRVAFYRDLPILFDEQAPWSEMPRQMLLPLVAYTFGAFTYLSRTLRASLLEVLHEDYIRTARAAGFAPWRILTRHALRNAWGPVITLFVSVFPALISGSVILERIFDIDGMGDTVFTATLTGDAPLLMAVFLLTGALTILGYLLADILYALADPRIAQRA
ncbi:MAG: ABC transporter permease [Bacteroidetes bacterium]|nr:MAG: ABC transporter permease [Bacteroidota bacterium]